MAQRPRHARTQQSAERREADTPVRLLGHNAEGGEHPQEPPQRGGVRAGGLRQGVDGPRAVSEQVGEAELGCDVDDLRRAEAVDQLQQRVWGRGWWGTFGHGRTSRPPPPMSTGAV